MTGFNDVRLYKWFVIVTAVAAIFLGVVSFYSIVKIEPKAKSLLESAAHSATGTAAESSTSEALKKSSNLYKEAYVILRNPQLFARYENFDADSEKIKKIIAYFDRLVYEGAMISPKDGVYLEDLLERRKLGSRLGRNTMVFFCFLSLVGAGFLIYEKRSAKA